MNLLTLLTLLMATGSLIVAFLAWRDKRIYARNAGLNEQLNGIRDDLKALQEKVNINERHLHVLDERVQNDIHTSANLLTTIGEKLDTLEQALWNR